MSKQYDELTDRLQQFILRQKMFFVGSAPRSDEGAINISPKGLDAFRIIDSKTVAYLDYTGSGVESIAHIKENRRLVIMFCSFDSSPLIVRLHGHASVIERSNPEWSVLQPLFQESRMARSIIKLSIKRIADSCGWGVPRYDFVGHREQYANYDEKTDDDGVRTLQMEHNMKSIDGLPGLSEPTL